MPRITPETRRALVAERKAQILAAAAKVFAQKGFERATIADIAKEAGVAEGSIYNYFKNKADLLVSIPRQFVQPAVQLLGGDRATRGLTHLPPAQFLAMAAHTMIDVVKHNSDIFRVLMSSLPTMSRATQAKYLEQVPLVALGMLETYFRAQVEAGVFRADVNPALAARMFPGLLMATVMFQEVLRLPMQQDYDELIVHAVNLFLRGVLTAPLPTPSPSRPRGKIRVAGQGTKRERKRQ